MCKYYRSDSLAAKHLLYMQFFLHRGIVHGYGRILHVFLGWFQSRKPQLHCQYIHCQPQNEITENLRQLHG